MLAGLNLYFMKSKAIISRKSIVVAVSAIVTYFLVTRIILANWDEIKAFIFALFS